jgi:hypothetical protein
VSYLELTQQKTFQYHIVKFESLEIMYLDEKEILLQIARQRVMDAHKDSFWNYWPKTQVSLGYFF